MKIVKQERGNKKKIENKLLLTRCEIISSWKSHRLQFAISKKFNPQKSSARFYYRWILLSTEPSNYWRKPKRSISNFNMIKFAFPRWFNWVFFIKIEFNALPWGSCKKQRKKERKFICSKKILKSWGRLTDSLSDSICMVSDRTAKELHGNTRKGDA